MKHKYYSQIQTLSTNAHGLALSMRCANADNIVFKRIKFEKLSDPNIAFPETLHEKKHPVNFQESAE